MATRLENAPEAVQDAAYLTPARFWSGTRKRLYGALALAAGVFAASSALTDWRDSHSLLINTSPSLPNWAFVLDKTHAPVRGALIFFDPPTSPLLVKHFGAHPAAFGKLVYGVGGDTVTRVGRTFFVNGREVATAKLTSTRGEALEPGPTGVIPRGCYFVGTLHKDGFDSRYAVIGWICTARLYGTGTAIL